MKPFDQFAIHLSMALTAIAHENNQTVGEDYYVTLEQVEHALLTIDEEA